MYDILVGPRCAYKLLLSRGRTEILSSTSAHWRYDEALLLLSLRKGAKGTTSFHSTRLRFVTTEPSMAPSRAVSAVNKEARTYRTNLMRGYR